MFPKTIVDYYSFLREIADVYASHNSQQSGGEGRKKINPFFPNTTDACDARNIVDVAPPMREHRLNILASWVETLAKILLQWPRQDDIGWDDVLSDPIACDWSECVATLKCDSIDRYVLADVWT